MIKCNIPKPTVKRLFLYIRCLKRVDVSIHPTISSKELADRLSLNANQVRKDFSYFGKFGKRGVGYRVTKLRKYLEKIAGITTTWNLAIVGMGNLGKAIFHYKGLEKSSFKIVAAFDKDRRKIGKKMGKGFEIMDIKDFSLVARKQKIDIVLLTVPAGAAQEVTDIVVKSKIKGILNFSNIHVKTPKDISVEDADFSIFLRALIFSIMYQEQCL